VGGAWWRVVQTELQTEVHNLEATASALDAQLATSQALLDALSKESSHLQADLATWAAQRGSRGGAADAQAAAARAIERRDAATSRHHQVKEVLDTLGGVKIVRMDDALLELLLSTIVPPGPAAPSPTVRFGRRACRVWEGDSASMDARDDAGCARAAAAWRRSSPRWCTACRWC
jgi:hypothetical protein